MLVFLEQDVSDDNKETQHMSDWRPLCVLSGVLSELFGWFLLNQYLSAETLILVLYLTEKQYKKQYYIWKKQNKTAEILILVFYWTGKQNTHDTTQPMKNTSNWIFVRVNWHGQMNLNFDLLQIFLKKKKKNLYVLPYSAPRKIKVLSYLKWLCFFSHSLVICWC